MMNAMWFSIALYTGAADDGEYREYFHWLQFVIATVTLAYSGQPFIKGAIQSLKAKSVGMDVSITTSANTDEEGRALLKVLGMPFRDN